MSPEMILNLINTPSRASDIYALGVTLWECTSRQPPLPPKPIGELLSLYNTFDNNDDRLTLLLPFPIRAPFLQTSLEDKYWFTLMEFAALSCLLWSTKHRPNATKLFQYLDGITPPPTSVMLSADHLSFPPTKYRSYNAIFLFNDQSGIIYNPDLQQKFASFKTSSADCNKMNAVGKQFRERIPDVITKNTTTIWNQQQLQPNANGTNTELNDNLNNAFPINNRKSNLPDIPPGRCKYIWIAITALVIIGATTAVVTLLQLRRPHALKPITAPTFKPTQAPTPVAKQASTPVAKQASTPAPTQAPARGYCFSNSTELYNSVREYIRDVDSATTKYGTMSDWCVGSVKNFSGLFYGSFTDDFEKFNEDISQWDTSQGTDMSYMFFYAENFNKDLSQWDTSQVKDMSSMFEGAKLFNQDISKWNTSQVKSMSNMFYDATNFNQDISQWDTSQVTDMSNMFTRSIKIFHNGMYQK
jgi:surface protein